MKDSKFGYHWIWLLPLHYVAAAYLHIKEKIEESGRMKVRVMKRYTKGSPEPYYEVDTWFDLLGPIGYWATQIRTINVDYAVSVFEDYKHNRRGSYRKAETLLIHYE